MKKRLILIVAVMAMMIPFAASAHVAPMQRTGWACSGTQNAVPYSPGHSLLCANPYGWGYEWWLIHWGG